MTFLATTYEPYFIIMLNNKQISERLPFRQNAFYSCDLDPESMTLIYEYDLKILTRSLKLALYKSRNNNNKRCACIPKQHFIDFKSFQKLSNVTAIQAERHTDRCNQMHYYTTFMGGKNIWDLLDSKFWNLAGTRCGQISASVSGWNQNRIMWWLLHCSACWWYARSHVTGL